MAIAKSSLHHLNVVSGVTNGHNDSNVEAEMKTYNDFGYIEAQMTLDTIVIRVICCVFRVIIWVAVMLSLKTAACIDREPCAQVNTPVHTAVRAVYLRVSASVACLICWFALANTSGTSTSRPALLS